MAERFDFTLDPVEVDVLGQALGVRTRIFPLRFRNTTIDPVRLAALAGKVEAGLAGRRLCVRGQLHSSVQTALGLFGGYRVAVAITGTDGLGRNITVAGMTDGAQALGVTQFDDRENLEFSLFSDDEFVDVLAGVLPPCGSAGGRTLTVERAADVEMSAMRRRRLDDAEYDDEETDAFGNIELRSTVRPRTAPRSARSRVRPEARVSELDRLAELMAGERRGGGHIAATGRGRGGRVVTAPSLGWVDTGEGRYLVHADHGAGGSMSARYVPAGRGTVAEAIREVISDVY